MKLNLSMPTWVVYQDQTGRIDADIHLDELDQADLDFMGCKVLGHPGFQHKIDAIRWVEDLVRKTGD